MKISFDTATEQVLKELEKTQKDFWNIPREEGILINTFIKMFNAQNVLELGTSNGYSGIWIAKALKKTGGHLTTIEFYEKRQQIAIENFKNCSVNDIITSIQGSAFDIINKFDKDTRFDFVFIDANKSEYVEYFKLIKPFLTQKVVILADNIISHLQKVQPFIKMVDDDDSFQYEILETSGGLLIAYRD